MQNETNIYWAIMTLSDKEWKDYLRKMEKRIKAEIGAMQPESKLRRKKIG